MLVKEAQVAFKNIVGLNAFVSNEQWSVIQLKAEYHAKFVAILQIIYQQERLAYFNNRIAITLNLTNKGKKINWCSIMLTQMSIELTWWTKYLKQIAAKLVTPNRKVATYYYGPIIEV
jgi:phospholipid N-methyltransferase